MLLNFLLIWTLFHIVIHIKEFLFMKLIKHNVFFVFCQVETFAQFIDFIGFNSLHTVSKNMICLLTA